MRLPDNIYNAVKPLFAHHAPWHNARKPENRSLRGPGTLFPGLKGIDEPGSGEQFLRFHRDMVRLFKWVLANTPGPAYPFSRRLVGTRNISQTTAVRRPDRAIERQARIAIG